MTNLLSSAALEAIGDVSHGAVKTDDVNAAFRAVGIDPRPVGVVVRRNSVFFPDGRSVAVQTIGSLDLTDPDVVAKVLRYTSRVAELFAAGRDADQSRLVRLRNALADDGYSVDAAGDPVAAITALAATANAALSDAAAIRQELTRLERALPDDTGALIGRAKNLVEATAKVILQLRGQPVSDGDKVPALVAKASEALGVHVTQAAGPQFEQIRRVLGRLHGLTHDVAELRNQVGDGHGMTGVPAVDAAAGRLAARAAIAWCAFMLEVAMGAGRPS